MGNKEINKNEEYLYSLPDYVNGKLPDGPVKSGIEDRINSDAEFRAEYESMLNTMKFVRNGSLEEPPEHYFNSLIPRINERIETGKTKTPALHPVFQVWRYIVPALTVILVMVIILRPGKDNIEVKSGDTENVTNIIKTIPDTLISVNVNDAVEEQADTESESPAPKVKNAKITKTVKNESESIIENISELLNESEETQDDNDYYIYESDFRNLSPAEQNEVLANLTNTKF